MNTSKFSDLDIFGKLTVVDLSLVGLAIISLPFSQIVAGIFALASVLLFIINCIVSVIKD